MMIVDWFLDTFSFWCYYPNTTDIRRSFSDFIDSLGPDQFESQDDRNRHTESFLEHGTFCFQIKRFPWDREVHSDYWIKNHLLGVHTTGYLSGHVLRPHLSREDSNTILLIIREAEVGSTSWSEQSNDIINIIEQFCLAFKPSYGIGTQRGEYLWWKTPQWYPPESKIWPINVFDFNRYSSTLHDRILNLCERKPSTMGFKKLEEWNRYTSYESSLLRV